MACEYKFTNPVEYQTQCEWNEVQRVNKQILTILYYLLPKYQKKKIIMRIFDDVIYFLPPTNLWINEGEFKVWIEIIRDDPKTIIATAIHKLELPPSITYCTDAGTGLFNFDSQSKKYIKCSRMPYGIVAQKIV